MVTSVGTSSRRRLAAPRPVGDADDSIQTTWDKKHACDLSRAVGARVGGLADAKYKLTESLGSNADHYQLLAYLTRFGLTEGVLVYCQPPDDGATAETDGQPWSTVEIRGAERRHHVYRLDVSGDRSQIEARLDRLAEWLLDRIGEAATETATG